MIKTEVGAHGVFRSHALRICALLSTAVLAVACAFACSGCNPMVQSASGSRDATGSTAADAPIAHAIAAADAPAPIAPLFLAPANVATADAAAAAARADLLWRDDDFAVDPDRTDWNYEPNGRKVVYLTIDDGPSDKTEQVLDVLDRYCCKATFFVVGHDPEHYHLIKEAYDRGHTIGLHTYSHDYAYVYSSVSSYFYDLGQIADVVEEQIGFVPCFIRFPGGSSNAVSASYCKGIMSSLVGAVQARGYQYFDWNVSTGDGSEHTSDELVEYATEPTELENIVMLCHDSTSKQPTVDALPRIIEHYQALGYTFEALDRDACVVHHGVSN